MNVERRTYRADRPDEARETPEDSSGPQAPAPISFRREWSLVTSLMTIAVFTYFGPSWLADLSNHLWFALMLTWLFTVILISAFAVVRHADHLAMKLGEPGGTLVLTLAVTGIAQLVFPHQTNGSLIMKDGKPIGSELIGQFFDDPKYFWGRPSATSPFPYNAGASSASNLGPTNPDLLKAVAVRAATLKKADPDQTAPVPADLVTASGSGLDPDISLAAALYQAPRVARARGIPEERLRQLVAEHTQGRQFGILDLQGRRAGHSGLTNGYVSQDIQGQVPGTEIFYSIQGEGSLVGVPSVFARVSGGGVWRKGVWGGKLGTLFPHYQEMTAAVHAASDHAAIWADLAI